jgi:hypothetical protein
VRHIGHDHASTQNTNLTYWYVELRNNLKVAALLQPLFGKVSSRNVVSILLGRTDTAEDEPWSW